ncbi:MAG: Nif3-like dinuclear metal center hexameric protein [Planctomycetes bacterium]|nr:Nif3-like dinuclear metal center hexameric protein [Planctomycetota bacterium]MCB9884612.1 Nif3-like dinuclear metal center hexameric protein [Planctomycetota bacterium]
MAAAPTFAAVLAALEQLAPPALAADWDNTGLLIEPAANRRTVRRLMLTIDLTAEVAAEAAAWHADLVVAYHPPIFSGLKRLVASDGKQRAVLAAARAGFAVYSPHTALDAVEGGIADWLAFGATDCTTPSLRACGEGDYGRIAVFEKPISLAALVRRLKQHLGVRHLQVARPTKTRTRLRDIAVAAGAGGSVLRGVRADVWLTGEMSHHDALAATAAGTTVLLAGHSNTERGYLRVLRELLGGELGRGCEMRLARVDRDPFRVV